MEIVFEEAAALGTFVLKNLVRIVPFLLVTIPLSVAVQHSGVAARIRRTLQRGPVLAVLVATFAGALSPLCSCGVIPVIAALLASGVPLAPVMSFWLASPSMDPEILFMSAGMIGWDLAVWRLGATLLMSLGAGLATMALERSGYFAQGLLREGLRHPEAVRPGTASPGRGEGSAAAVAAAPRAALAVPALLRETALVTGRMLLLMVAAFVLEALVVRFVPAQAVAAVLGRSSAFAIPLAVLVGVPLYTTNLSALGLISGLLHQGMDAGAALSFLIGGAVTTIPAMSAVFGVVKPRVFALYVGFAAAGSLLAGYAFRLAHL